MSTEFIYLIISLTANIIILICLFSPNITFLIHKKFFEWKEVNRLKPDNHQFYIEHFTTSDTYYPRFENQYISENDMTGVVEIMDELFPYITRGFKTRDDAIDVILQFKRQRLKEDICIIKIKDAVKLTE